MTLELYLNNHKVRYSHYAVHSLTMHEALKILKLFMYT